MMVLGPGHIVTRSEAPLGDSDNRYVAIASMYRLSTLSRLPFSPSTLGHYAWGPPLTWHSLRADISDRFRGRRDKGK